MPELPEVEVIRQGIAPMLIARTIIRVKSSGLALRLPIPRTKIERYIKDQPITAVRRRAKYLLVNMANNAALIIHLGMTGRLGMFRADQSPAPHDHLCCLLDNGLELRFNDTRRFGSIQVLPPDSDEGHFFAALGPEPLGDDFTVDYMQNRAGKRRQPLKNFLMNSHVVAGIGNIYANEITFAASISPTRTVNKISRREWQTIITSTREILQKAIAAGGSTISDFINAGGKPGYFQLQLRVYGRAGEPCPICGTAIEKTSMAGRATFWCHHCQH
ncbi:MAG TPA: bifunctional DNA-formamidopyrimidine glycosylase/DNA-(apurinic or apyrimidinic site) lyase [Desulfobacterales bacterium]|nr:bifunctional DNA-formamidopyrimidine glycosylase/DNA-(apurinic or apyrimidinic site) lyase [Desulfobacterales bacterium]